MWASSDVHTINLTYDFNNTYNVDIASYKPQSTTCNGHSRSEQKTVHNRYIFRRIINNVLFIKLGADLDMI